MNLKVESLNYLFNLLFKYFNISYILKIQDNFFGKKLQNKIQALTNLSLLAFIKVKWK